MSKFFLTWDINKETNICTFNEYLDTCKFTTQTIINTAYQLTQYKDNLELLKTFITHHVFTSCMTVTPFNYILCALENRNLEAAKIIRQEYPDTYSNKNVMTIFNSNLFSGTLHFDAFIWILDSFQVQCTDMDCDAVQIAIKQKSLETLKYCVENQGILLCGSETDLLILAFNESTDDICMYVYNNLPFSEQRLVQARDLALATGRWTVYTSLGGSKSSTLSSCFIDMITSTINPVKMSNFHVSFQNHEDLNSSSDYRTCKFILPATTNRDFEFLKYIVTNRPSITWDVLETLSKNTHFICDDDQEDFLELLEICCKQESLYHTGEIFINIAIKYKWKIVFDLLTMYMTIDKAYEDYISDSVSKPNYMLIFESKEQCIRNSEYASEHLESIIDNGIISINPILYLINNYKEVHDYFVANSSKIIKRISFSYTNSNLVDILYAFDAKFSRTTLDNHIRNGTIPSEFMANIFNVDFPQREQYLNRIQRYSLLNFSFETFLFTNELCTINVPEISYMDFDDVLTFEKFFSMNDNPEYYKQCFLDNISNIDSIIPTILLFVAWNCEFSTEEMDLITDKLSMTKYSEYILVFLKQNPMYNVTRFKHIIYFKNANLSREFEKLYPELYDFSVVEKFEY